MYLLEEEVAVRFPASGVEDSVSPAIAVKLLCELRQRKRNAWLVRCLMSEMGIERAAAGTARVRQLPANNIDATATEHILSFCFRSASSVIWSGRGWF
jgi:hypothetical protein